MYIYKSRFLTRGEVWYDEEPHDTRSVDWLVFHQRSRPVPGARNTNFFTYAIDLSVSHDQLLANLNKDTAYKIRRARERDKILCESCDPRDPAVLDEFEAMYNIFARMKGLAPLVRARTESMAAAGVLDLSVAKDPQGDALVYHADYRNRSRATSLELPSLYRGLSDNAGRNLVSRANRLLTWNNILRYQEQGLQWFDFGGWYHGSDPAMLKINDFKRGFGGQVVREFQCERVTTLKGWLALRAGELRQRAKTFPFRPGKPASGTPPELVQNRKAVAVD